MFERWLHNIYLATVAVPFTGGVGIMDRVLKTRLLTPARLYTPKFNSCVTGMLARLNFRHCVVLCGV